MLIRLRAAIALTAALCAVFLLVTFGPQPSRWSLTTAPPRDHALPGDYLQLMHGLNSSPPDHPPGDESVKDEQAQDAHGGEHEGDRTSPDDDAAVDGGNASPVSPVATDAGVPEPEQTQGTNNSSITTATPPPAETHVIQPDVEASQNLGDTSPLRADTLRYLISIRDFDDTSLRRVKCPKPDDKRYGYLRNLTSTTASGTRPYFIAINLHNNTAVLPRLLGSLMAAIRTLGPENVALSIVEGRSTDGTYEILANLHMALPLGVKYFFSTSVIDPWADGRIGALATLRNLAVAPLLAHPSLFPADDTTVLFLNDIAACPDEMLELLHQKVLQKADLTCGMDWNVKNRRLTFYDVWIARSMSGAPFFHIPFGGDWNESMHLFPFDTDADRLARARLGRVLPFQVFECWNGAVAFNAKPLITEGVRFRINRDDECYQAEVSTFVKDMWVRGHGRVAVVPSVNFAYDYDTAKRVQREKGLVGKWAKEHHDNPEDEMIRWVERPPAKVLCMPNWVDQPQYWVPWNE